MRFVITFVALVVFGCLPLEASSLNYPEDLAISRLQSVLMIYQTQTEKIPSSWYDIANSKDHQQMMNELVNNALGDDIKSYYSFASGELKVTKNESARATFEGNPVLVIGKGPVIRSEGHHPGRYIIWVGEDQKFNVDWLKESDIEEMYRRSDVDYNPVSLEQPRRMYVPEQKIDNQNSRETHHHHDHGVAGHDQVHSHHEQSQQTKSVGADRPSEQPKTASTTVEAEQESAFFLWFWIGVAVVSVGVVLFLVIRQKSA